MIDQTQTTLYPGGILNTGFAVDWAQERQHEAKPADPTGPKTPDGGQPYAYQQIPARADATCAANQALHPEATDLMAKIRANDHYVPEVADPLSPITFVNKINVPSFMACQFTDEQTGGHCPTLAEHMTGTDKKWFTYTNGVHTDSLDPETYNRLYDFLSIYVAQQAPATNPFTALVHGSWPVAMQAICGIGGPGGSPPPDATLPPDPIQPQPTLAAAQAAFEALPQIRVLFDNGAGNASHPGWPYPGFEQSFSSFPIPGTDARSWYLAPGGALADQSASRSRGRRVHLGCPRPAADRLHRRHRLGRRRPLDRDPELPVDPGSRRHRRLVRDRAAEPRHRRGRRRPRGPLGALLDAERRPAGDDQRGPPDGKETFVQNGWIRTKARKLDDAKSTELEPVPSFRQEDFQDMPSDQFVPVTIPLYYEGHMYRAGSRIRVRISAPNGDQPIWSFGEADPAGQANVAIGYGGSMPSRLLLPVIPGVEPPTGAAAVSGPAGRAVPRLPALREPRRPSSGVGAGNAGGRSGSRLSTGAPLGRVESLGDVDRLAGDPPVADLEDADAVVRRAVVVADRQLRHPDVTLSPHLAELEAGVRRSSCSATPGSCPLPRTARRTAGTRAPRPRCTSRGRGPGRCRNCRSAAGASTGRSRRPCAGRARRLRRRRPSAQQPRPQPPAEPVQEERRQDREDQQERVRIGQVHLGLVLPAELEAEQDEHSEERAGDETTKQRVSAARVLGAAADPAEQGEHDADQVEGRRESEGQPAEQPEHGREDRASKSRRADDISSHWGGLYITALRLRLSSRADPSAPTGIRATARATSGTASALDRIRIYDLRPQS